MTLDNKGNEVVWNRDPAASGWRSRALVGAGYWPDGKRFELVAYDDGRWFVDGPPIGHEVAQGREVDGKAAKSRALAVYRSLSAKVPE